MIGMMKCIMTLAQNRSPHIIERTFGHTTLMHHWFNIILVDVMLHTHYFNLCAGMDQTILLDVKVIKHRVNHHILYDVICVIKGGDKITLYMYSASSCLPSVQ